MSRLNVKIVTHTGCDIPLERAKELGVIVIPDLVIFDGKSYQNMTEITAEAFYDKMKAADRLPTSSHPSVGDFEREFAALQDCDEILFLSITSGMSGTYSTAVTAQKRLEERGCPLQISVYDTQQCSHGMGMMVEEAAKMAAEGMTKGEIIYRLDEIRSRIGVYFVLETLKYARKGGRVGAIKALAADALGIKPLLQFDKGTVSDIGITRNFADGLSAVMKKYREQGQYGGEVILFHAQNPQGAGKLAELVRKEDPGCRIRTEAVGPVIGIYTGIGCVGMSFWKKENSSGLE